MADNQKGLSVYVISSISISFHSMTNSNISYEIKKIHSNKDFTCRRKFTPLCHQPVFQDSALNIVTHKYIAGVVWLWREMCFSPGRAEQHLQAAPFSSGSDTNLLVTSFALFYCWIVTTNKVIVHKSCGLLLLFVQCTTYTFGRAQSCNLKKKGAYESK